MGGGGQDTEDYGKISSKQLNGGEGFIYELILVKEPTLGAVPDQGWNNANS